MECWYRMVNPNNSATPFDIAAQKSKDQTACAHDMQLVHFYTSNKALKFQRQCVRCGHKSQEVKQSELTRKQMDEAPLRDETIEKRFEQKRDEIFQEEFKREMDSYKNEARQAYDEYRKSEAWQEKRKKVLKRAKGICEGCGVNEPTQVHHKTYQRLFKEMLFDLAALCEDCHDEIHSEQELGEELERIAKRRGWKIE